MPATNSTPNYDLPIYLPEDHFSVLGDLNEAMTTIDGELATASQSVTAAAANAAAALTAAERADSQSAEARTSAQAATVSASQASTAAASAQTLAEAATADAADAKSVATAARATAQSAASTAATADSNASSALAAATEASQLATQAVEEQGFLRSKSLEQDMAIASGDRVTDVITLPLTGLVVGRVYSVTSLMEMHIPTGVGNDKSMQVLLDSGLIYEEVYNDDEFRVTLSCTVPFKATSTTHVITVKCDSAATGTFDILAQGTHVYVW